MDYKKEYELLREQIDHERWEGERRSEEAYQRREQERQRKEREMAEAECWADGWDDAFPKALRRLSKEAKEEAEFRVELEAQGENPDKYDSWFAEQAEEHDYAHTAYQEEVQAVHERVRRIRERAERLIAHPRCNVKKGRKLPREYNGRLL